MAWAENNYIETRFVGGMNCSVEPHTLDRDTGELPDIMNMVCRTQALRTRKGFVRILDLFAEYGCVPINAPSGLFHFEYEPDLPPDISGEGGGGVTGGGGTILPYIEGGGGSGGGGGGGGNVNPKPKPEPEPVPEPVSAWSVTGPGSIYPYVPFELTITRNSGTGKPTWLMGFLSGYAGSYKGTEKWLSEVSSGVWKREVTMTNLNRSIESVTYKAGSSSASYGECTLDYALYGFYPDLPETVTVGESFEITVECRDVNVIENYKGNGRGCVLTWTFLKANGQPASGSVSVTGATWTNGVMKANGVPRTVDGVRLRLTTTFLGEEHSDEAIVNAGAVGISVDEAPVALHIYGKGSTLKISATGEGEFNPSYLTVSCTIDGATVNLNDVLELATAEGGSRDISFASGWSEQNVWSKSIRARARSTYAGDTLHIAFSYLNGEEHYTETADIDIEDTIVASLVASPSSIYTGDSVNMTATINGNVDVALDIDRVPFESGFLAHADDDGFDVEVVSNGISRQYWRETSNGLFCIFAIEVTGDPEVLPKTLRYAFGIGEEWLAYADIAVALPNYAAMLAEAINERILAKTGTAGTYTENDGASTLRGAAISATYDYIDGEVETDGTYSNYSSNNPLPLLNAEDTVAWYADSYNKVCHVNEMALNRSSGNCSFESVTQTWSGSSSSSDFDFDVDEDRYSKWRKMARAARSDFSLQSESSGYSESINTYISQGGNDNGVNISGQFQKIRFLITATLHVSARAYLIGVPYKIRISGEEAVYNSFGAEGVPGFEVKQRFYANVPANGSGYSDWIGNISNHSPASVDPKDYETLPSGYWYYREGYEFSFPYPRKSSAYKIVVDYNFTHKK